MGTFSQKDDIGTVSRSTLLCALSFSLSCSFNSSTSQGVTDGGSGIDSGPGIDADLVKPLPTRFSSDYEIWKVPESGTEKGFYTTNSYAATEYWSLLDLDGDGRLELVQTADPTKSSAPWSDASGAYWKVFRSGESGFMDPTQKRIPAPADTRFGFYTTARASAWSLYDLDGDGLQDMVEFLDPLTNLVWNVDGDLSWHYLRGTVVGFAEATSWPLPELANLPLRGLKTCYTVGCWTVLDLTGDRRPDFVHTSDPAPLMAFDSPAAPNWHVYPNTGAGFSSSFIKWQLPSTGRDKGFFGTDWYTLSKTMDLDLDTQPDLVQTQIYPSGGLHYDGNQPYWKLFRMGEAGFSVEAESWLIPSIGAAGGVSTTTVSNGSSQWDTIDLNSDGHLDLVVTANHAADVPAVWGSPNSDQWKVYFGTGIGFSANPQAWSLPDSQLDDGFYAVEISNGNQQWSLLDLDADGQVELVQTTDPATGMVWKTADDDPHWRVYQAIP